MFSIVGLRWWQEIDPAFAADGRQPLEIRRAGRRRVARIVDRLPQGGDYAAWGTNIFHYLREGGLPLTELAERTHTTKQALLYTINQLEAAGYVERVPDPTDGRAKIIRLTQRGWEVRRVGDQILANIEHECVQKLGEERMRQFEALIKDVSGVLEENRAVTTKSTGGRRSEEWL